jgi:hypothetical protein
MTRLKKDFALLVIALMTLVLNSGATVMTPTPGMIEKDLDVSQLA